jgi:tRNA(Ile2)-agmatinylcytidine synthase
VTVIGIDDTDSRTQGLCTTYAAAQIATDLGDDYVRTLLVRLNPAVEHKTRGNAALAVHCETPPERALAVASEWLDIARTDDDQTNPGVVVFDDDPDAVPDPVSDFTTAAVHEIHDIETARRHCDSPSFRTATRGNGRGLIGALAAVGAWVAFDEWTYECISYRERECWGTDRSVAYESVRRAAEEWYPTVWDTLDREEETAVCVPRTPCPVLHGIRGDDPEGVLAVAEEIESEPVASRHLFVTNQGTDAHLQDGTAGTVTDGQAYRVTGTVCAEPTTREGGHVFFAIADEDDASLPCVAFEPTKRFRDRVRPLRIGDRVTVCGEVQDGTLKLEKLAVRDLVRTELVTPTCPDCGRSMESAGRSAGYRCRDCKTTADGKQPREIDRDLELGWYEVPPCARRHVAKPLVRGGFDGPTHPER